MVRIKFKSDIARLENRRKKRHLWVIKNREKHHKKYMETREKRCIYDKQIIMSNKIIVQHVYTNGFMKCSLCGYDSDIDALTIDHINNNGKEHRKQLNVYASKDLYRWLIKNNFPDGFQILCMNCNMLKQINEGIHNKRVWIA